MKQHCCQNAKVWKAVSYSYHSQQQAQAKSTARQTDRPLTSLAYIRCVCFGALVTLVTLVFHPRLITKLCVRACAQSR